MKNLNDLLAETKRICEAAPLTDFDKCEIAVAGGGKARDVVAFIAHARVVAELKETLVDQERRWSAQLNQAADELRLSLVELAERDKQIAYLNDELKRTRDDYVEADRSLATARETIAILRAEVQAAADDGDWDAAAVLASLDGSKA